MAEFDLNQYFGLLENGKEEEAISYRASFIPDYIYKFVSLSDDADNNEKKLTSLEENKIWFASSKVQNDPFDFKGIYLNKKELIEHKFPESSLELFDKATEKAFLLAAFTENMHDNLSMWAHYANNHKGYCVKYRVTNKRIIRNVIYEPKRIATASIFANLVNAAVKANDPTATVEEKKQAMADANFYSAIMFEIFFIKHDSWKSEKEYRILQLNSDDVNGMNVAVEKLGLIPEAVYCGINCEHTEKIETIAKKINLNFYKCKLSETEFSVFE